MFFINMLEEMKGEGDRIHVHIGRCDGLEQFHQGVLLLSGENS
jgi:hypothetical protein